MRLFAALPLPDAPRANLAEAVANLERLQWPVKWVGRDHYHLTLKFYGDVEPGRAAAIAGMLAEAARNVPALDMSLDGLGAFPTPQRARVLWAGLTGPPDLELLQDRVERGSEALGFPLEGKAFCPHVTLGRVRERERLPAGAAERLESARVGGSFLAESMVLFESILTPQGPQYTARHTFRLT
jgi:2'-5' RNA ligase